MKIRETNGQESIRSLKRRRHRDQHHHGAGTQGPAQPGFPGLVAALARLHELRAQFHLCRHFLEQARVWKLPHERHVVRSAIFTLKAAMKKLGARGLGFAHLIVATLAVLWAYTSYKYNWLNIGGGVGDIDFWIVTGNIASYSFLGAWLSLLVITAFNSKTLFPTFKAKVAS